MCLPTTPEIRRPRSVSPKPSCSSACRASTRSRSARRPRDKPGDVAAQIAAADLDLVGGHVEDAFGRLIETVKRTAGDDRDSARVRLLELFDVVGADDPRVTAARRALARALF